MSNSTAAQPIIKTWQERTGNHNIRPGSVKHMIAEISELRAALASQSQAGVEKTSEVRTAEWQPIETAPKDKEIWAFNGEQGRMKWSEGDCWALWVWVDELLADTDPSPDQPTHWMHLPTPPSTADSAGTGAMGEGAEA